MHIEQVPREETSLFFIFRADCANRAKKETFFAKFFCQVFFYIFYAKFLDAFSHLSASLRISPSVYRSVGPLVRPSHTSWIYNLQLHLGIMDVKGPTNFICYWRISVTLWSGIAGFNCISNEAFKDFNIL